MSFDWGSLAAAFGGVGTVLNDMNKRDDEARLKKELAEQEEARQMALEQMREEAQTRRDAATEKAALERDQIIRDRNRADVARTREEDAAAVSQARQGVQGGMINSALQSGSDNTDSLGQSFDTSSSAPVRNSDLADSLLASGRGDLAKPYFERADKEDTKAMADKQFGLTEKSTNATIKHQEETLKLDRARLAEAVKTGKINQEEAAQRLEMLKVQGSALNALSEAYKPDSKVTPEQQRKATDYYLATLGKLQNSHELKQTYSTLLKEARAAKSDIANNTPEQQASANALYNSVLENGQAIFGKSFGLAEKGDGGKPDTKADLFAGMKPQGEAITQKDGAWYYKRNAYKSKEEAREAQRRDLNRG